MFKYNCIALASISALLLVGCQTADEPAKVAAATPAKPVAKAATSAKPKVNEADAKREALRKAMADFVAPFPNRTDMFAPPKVKASVKGTRVAEGDVQLKGLVNVDEPKVILDIEGATTLLAVGGEKYGVKVVSIDQHKVTLQRGPTRWVASLD